MPVASRRSRRAQPSEDIEDQPTQNGHEEVDDEVDDRARRGTGKSKKSKAAPKRQVASEDENEEMDAGDGAADGDDDIIDVDNFADQPIRHADLKKLQNVLVEWQNTMQLLGSPANDLGDIGASVADAAETEKDKKSLIELEGVMKAFIDIHGEMQSHHDTMNNLYQNIARGEDVVDIAAKYDEGLLTAKGNYDRKTTRQKYAKNEWYNKYKQALYEVEHAGEAMPPITDFIPKEDGDVSDEDEEVEIGGATQDYKCPLTLRLLEDPVTSQICHHSFSRDALRDMFRTGPATKVCPASGCRQKITLADCKPNKDLAKKVRNFQRRQRNLETNQEAEEIVE